MIVDTLLAKLFGRSMCDESHKLKNVHSKATQLFARFFCTKTWLF